MARNVILLISTLAVLGVLFAGYVLIVDDPVTEPARTQAAIEQLPVEPPSEQQRLSIVGAIQVPPGEAVELKFYDQQTGRITELFSCEEWTPVSGADDQIHVTSPEMTMWLRSGVVVTISAAEGQITVDRLERGRGRPQVGWLRGGVQIRIDRGTGRERSPLAERPADLITIDLEQLDFDFELGELNTDGPLRITAAEFEVAGTGLHLVWNEADNVVETLQLRQGERLVLYGGSGLLGSSGRIVAADVSSGHSDEAMKRRSGEGLVAADVSSAERPEHPLTPPPAPALRTTAYECVLTGTVVAEQFEDEQLVGVLTADEVRVLFDIRGTGDRWLGGRPASAAAGPSPVTTQPQLRQRLVVRWQGPLHLGPAPPAPGEAPRRHFEARGAPVRLTRGDGFVTCGWLEYFEETQQAWLRPGADGLVEFGLGAGRTASARTVYIDGGAGVVKLVGEVRLTTQLTEGHGKQQRSLHCTQWAELRMVSSAAADSGAPTGSAGDMLGRRLESASFVGEARVELGMQTLTAHRIDAGFRPGREDEPADIALETALASGNVRLTQRNEALECAQLALEFGVADSGELYPCRMEAWGSVMLARERSWLRGRQVQAEMQPAPPDPGPETPDFLLTTLNIVGDAELRDPRNQIAARGEQIFAVFTGLNELSHGFVRGTSEHHGLVHRSPYTVGGEQIDLDWRSKTLQVEGPARLKFKAVRSFQGQRRPEPTAVDVRCSESLNVDGIRNAVHLAGGVVAVSGAEQLRADTLTLLMEDVEQADPQPPRPTLRELLRQARRALEQAAGGPAERDWLDLSEEQSVRLRKEPVRLIARGALLQTETYQPGDELPAMHSSISAPLLEVDIVRREMVTRGVTRLGLINRRLDPEERQEGELLGIPSALITRGPSQTAIQCAGSMVYALGEEGPERRDAVLLEDDVLFVHRTGAEMVSLEQMFPQGRIDADLLSRLTSRNTSLQCDRLECGLLVGGQGGGESAPAAGGSAARLTWLLAAGQTYLRDEQDDVIREVWANQLDFDRPLALMRVLGTPQVHARIYESNRRTEESRVIVGEEFVIDLRANTIRTGQMSGEFVDTLDRPDVGRYNR